MTESSTLYKQIDSFFSSLWAQPSLQRKHSPCIRLRLLCTTLFCTTSPFYPVRSYTTTQRHFKIPFFTTKQRKPRRAKTTWWATSTSSRVQGPQTPCSERVFLLTLLSSEGSSVWLWESWKVCCETYSPLVCKIAWSRNFIPKLEKTRTTGLTIILKGLLQILCELFNWEITLKTVQLSVITFGATGSIKFLIQSGAAAAVANRISSNSSLSRPRRS